MMSEVSGSDEPSSMVKSDTYREEERLYLASRAIPPYGIVYDRDVLYQQGQQVRDNIDLQPHRSDLGDPVGCFQQNRVVGAPCSLLVVDDLPLIEVLLSERGCRRLCDGLHGINNKGMFPEV